MSAVTNESRLPLPEARVLLADDNPISQNTTCFMLSYLGVEVDVAEHGRQALELLSRRSYDLILMDCQMPVMDGYETTRAIRRREADRLAAGDPDSAGRPRPLRVPIVALSGRVHRDDRKICLEQGMDDCLGKPFDLDRLRDCLVRWLVVERAEVSP